MANGTAHDGSGIDDRWFQVDSATDVVDRTGTPVKTSSIMTKITF